MSMSEAGKLGYLKSKKYMEKWRNDSTKKALLKNKDNKCKNCNKEIPFEKRRNKFCSKSCSAHFNNSKRIKNQENIIPNCSEQNINYVILEKFCINCKKILSVLQKKFCSHKCSSDYRKKDRENEIVSNNDFKNVANPTIRRILIKMKENKCSICKMQANWQGKNLVLIIDHIDGNSENTNIDNFRLVCPNCDSQLPTYKGRNIGNGRHKRRERYKDGKSY